MQRDSDDCSFVALVLEGDMVLTVYASLALKILQQSDSHYAMLVLARPSVVIMATWLSHGERWKSKVPGGKPGR